MKKISKKEFGKGWAFTVDQGYVYSINNAAIFKVGDKEYQLNGLAETRGYALIDPIWKENPDIPGTKIDIGPFIDMALNNPMIEDEYNECRKKWALLKRIRQLRDLADKLSVDDNNFQYHLNCIKKEVKYIQFYLSALRSK